MHSDSSDINDWTSSRKGAKRKRPRMECNLSDAEEGEVGSDPFEDEDDDLDEDLFRGEEDKQRLLKMSEKEREEELYRRSERREALKIRRDVKKRLQEKKEKEMAEKDSKDILRERRAEASSSKPTQKTSAYANVFSSDSEQDSDSNAGSVSANLPDRKLTLALQKEGRSKRLQELADRRKEMRNKKETVYSVSEDERDGGRSRPKRHSHGGVYSGSSSSSRSSRSPNSRSDHKRRCSRFSSSGSSSVASSVSSDDERGRSRSPEVQYISTLEQLLKCRLSRFKLEMWVHMPFFDELVKGCFVKVYIGQPKGKPLYRIAEIAGVKEMNSPYDLGNTRTNKGIVLSVAGDAKTYRCMYVSNSPFTQDEFDWWRKYLEQKHLKPPTTAFIDRKAAEIHQALSAPMNDERIINQVVASKKRWARRPTNYALRKAELAKEAEAAREAQDVDAARRLAEEVAELEAEAERLERRRTAGFRSITAINQRNRELSLRNAEVALLRDSAGADAKQEDDNLFNRITSQPVIASQSYLERLRRKRMANVDGTDFEGNDEGADGGEATQVSRDASSDDAEARGEISVTRRTRVGLPKPPAESLHEIHNFELDIHVDVDPLEHGVGGNTIIEGDGGGTHRSMSTPAIPASSIGAPATDTPRNSSTPNRRFLNLQEYKRRRGLI